jgi:hypothetical protein
MKVSIVILLAIAVFGTSISSYVDPKPQSVPSYHGHPDRGGSFVVPALIWDRARSIRFDEGFRSPECVISGGEEAGLCATYTQ